MIKTQTSAGNGEYLTAISALPDRGSTVIAGTLPQLRKFAIFFSRLKSFASFEKISTFPTLSSKVEISSKMENEEISSKPVFTMGKP